jgi:uncharacterized membrane protein
MRHRLRNYLIAGLLVTLPLAVTVVVLLWLFRTLDHLLSPFLAVLGIRLPGLGLVSGVLLILTAGFMASNVLGRRIVHAFDRVMLRIPLARTIYSATKQLSDSLLRQNRMALREAVLVEWPRHGLYALGFVTGETRGEVQEVAKERVVNVFIMHTPNPATGFVCLVPESQLIKLDMSVEDAIKLVVSGGILTPVPQRRIGALVRPRDRFE